MNADSQQHKARRDDILIELARLKHKRQMPVSKIGMDQVRTFCEALKERFMGRSSNLGKAYLRLLIDEIRFSGQEVTIIGSYAKLMQAIPKIKPGHHRMVPGFVGDWLLG